MTTRERLEQIKARAEQATEGPWEVWDGPSYVGGGADLCIGAGETWLANMDHRNCVNQEQHQCGGSIPPCKRKPDTDICSTTGCRCSGECPEENHISEEQKANADLIASARTDVPQMASALLAILELHKPGECHCGEDQTCCFEGQTRCDACLDPVPCSTVRLIDEHMSERGK